MRYFDTGGRNPEHSLARWLEEEMRGEVNELRIQTGFFSLEGTGFLIPALERCKANDWTTKILIGSNDANTLRLCTKSNVVNTAWRRPARPSLHNFSRACRNA